MRNLSALQLVRLVRAAGCPTKVIVISDEHSEVAIGMYLRRGMDGYLLDNQPTHQIHSALEYVADGGCYIPPVFRRSRIELELDRADVRPARTVATPARKRRARVRR